MAQTTFDALNRTTQVKYLVDNSVETFGYDAAGNISSSANGTVTYTFQFDSLNRLLSKTDSRGRSLSFTYSKAGNLLTKTTFSGAVTTYSYDSANHLVSMSNPGYVSVNYQNDAAGRVLSRILSSGAKSLYTYDAAGWMTGQKHVDATGATIVDQSYTRDRVGNITAINVAGTGTTNYTLDALYRLNTVAAPNAAGSEAFSYDRLGNRLTATRGGTSIGAGGSTTYYYVYYPATQTGAVAGYTPTNNNRLKEIRIGSVGGTLDASFAYDNEGRLISQTGSTTRTPTWDAKGRLSGVGNETYAYDPLNHRIRRSGGALGTPDYFLEGDHLESVCAGNKIQEKYFRGLSIDELVAGFTMQNNKLTPFFFQHDQVNSVVAVSKPNGGTQQWATYWAFGEDQSSAGTAVSRLKYTGREDDGNGLYQYRARYYDPKLGRFLSEDPIKFVAGINFYSYVKNNPINANDPSGNIPLPLVTGAIGAAAGGVGSAAGQIISNGGFDNFNWTNVGVATGVGFVAGVAAPYTAVTWLGAAATGAASNVLQYGITQKINGDSITATGVAINGVTGLVGGTIGGPVNKAAGLAFSETSPWIDAAFQAVK